MFGAKLEPESHGRARWALEKELRKAGMLVPESAPLAPGRWIVGPSPFGKRERIELTAQQLLTGLLIVGPTGAGKTSGNIAPNVARWTSGSVVVTDPKSELWAKTAGYYSRAIRFAPYDPGASECFNPVPLLGSNPRLARLCARAIVEADGGRGQERVWRDTSTALLAALFCHVAGLENPAQRNLASVYDFLTYPGHAGTKYIDALGASGSEVARKYAVKISFADAKLRGSIMLPTAEMLAWLEDPLIRRFVGADSFAPDFRAWTRPGTAVYLCVEDTDAAELQAFTSLFWTVVLYQLKRVERHGPVCLVLDELANVGRIPGFERDVTINRGYGIATVGCLQAKSQADDLYGRDKASTIVGNLRSKIVMSGLDYDTGELVSKMLGSKTEVVEKESRTSRGGFFGGGDSSKTESQSEHARRLLYPDDINALEWEKQICFFPYQRPLMTERYLFAGGVEAPKAAGLGAERTAYPMPAGRVEVRATKLLIPSVPDEQHDGESEPEEKEQNAGADHGSARILRAAVEAEQLINSDKEESRHDDESSRTLTPGVQKNDRAERRQVR